MKCGPASSERPPTIYGYGVAADESGVYVAGQTMGALSGQTSDSNGNAFVRKYDLQGNLAWTRLFGSSNYLRCG